MFACLLREGEPGPPAAAPAGGQGGNELAQLGREWTPRVETVHPGMIVLDASGLTRLFGAPETWARRLMAAARARGWRVRVAVAGTRMAAILLALGRSGVTAVAPGHEAAALAPLPLTWLAHLETRGAFDHPTSRTGRAVRAAQAAADSMLDTLGRWGLTTLGDLAALPGDEVASRFGAAGRRWHARAQGRDPQPLVDDREARRFEATCDLDWPIEGLEPLSFVLARLLEPLCADLQREERGAARVGTRLDLVTRAAHDRRLQLPAPMNDPKVLRTLILLDLEAHPPGAGIDRVSIRLDPAPGRRVQFALFQRPLPAPDEVATLMARLNALVGEGRCGSPRLLETHRPGAFALEPFAPRDPRRREQASPDLSIDTRSAAAGSRPSQARDRGQPQAILRRFRQPLPVRVTLADGRPARVGPVGAGLTGGIVEVCAGPWRTSGAWWSAQPWDRDEWDVALHGGLVYRVSRVSPEGQWLLEGVWD